jgi:hypothetical protein
MTEIHPGAIGLSGGLKGQFLKQHRAEILSFYHQNGPDATLIRFNMRQNTLEVFLSGKSYNPESMTEAQRALEISKTSIEMSRANARQIAGLSEKYDELSPLLEIVKGVTRAMAITWQRETESRTLKHLDFGDRLGK